MYQAIEFVETSVFTRQIDELATDDELRVLQAELIGQPDKGSLIKGSGGLRKVRTRVKAAVFVLSITGGMRNGFICCWPSPSRSGIPCLPVNWTF